MALSEIEKLERRYADNPQGLTFAPLAEVHRKNGDVARALELLRPGLTIHPDYIPASIVLGRCQLDLGDLPAAETAFAHVLGLDGENVIALKALADITERQARFDEAERWLRTLLAIDLSNDDARDQLGRVEAARRQTESAALVPRCADAALAVPSRAEGPAAGDEAADAPPAEEPVSLDAGSVETSSDHASPAASLSPMPEPVHGRMLGWVTESGSPDADEAVPLELEELDTLVDLDGPRPEGIQLEQPVTLEDPVQPLAGLVGRDERVDDASSPGAGGDFRVEMAEDIVLNSSGGGEFQVANAAEELLAMRGPQGAVPAVPVPAVPEASAPEASAPEASLSSLPEPSRSELWLPEPPPEDAPAMAEPEMAEPAMAELEVATPAPWEVPVAEPPRQPELDLVVTESMAALFLQQGHPTEALTVYRHLERRSGGEPRFQAKIAELERIITAHPAPAPPPLETMATEPAAPPPAYSVLVTHGQSVRAFLRGVLAARLPAVAKGPSVHGEPARPGAAEPEGAPTRPAHDSLSLSSVFGEDSTPTLPAVPAAGSSGPGQGGVSYDEFFGVAGASSAPRPSRAPDPKSEDLDQFHAWLQNLKR